MDKKQKQDNSKAPIIDAIVVHLTLPKPKQPEPPRVIFEYANGWDVYVTGVKNEHEAVHAFLSTIATNQNVIMDCTANKAVKDEDGRYKIWVGVNPAINPDAVSQSVREKN